MGVGGRALAQGAGEMHLPAARGGMILYQPKNMGMGIKRFSEILSEDLTDLHSLLKVEKAVGLLPSELKGTLQYTA